MMKRGGNIRTGWLLAASLLACAALRVGGRWALSRGFAALFGLWNVNAGNVHRAPAWARTIYAWHGSFITVLVSVAMLALVLGLRRLWQLRDRQPFSAKSFLLPSAIGLAGALTVMLVSLLPDSSRLTWPLSAPRFSFNLLPLCAVGLLAALAEEAFTKRALYDGVRGRWGGGWATAATCLTFLAMNVAWPMRVISALNVLLLGALCCIVFERYGLWAAVGLRWGWGVGIQLLMGFGGGDAALYRLYGVSETLLTGGDAGPMAGLWATLLLSVGIMYLVLPRQGRNTRSAPDTTRKSKGRSS